MMCRLKILRCVICVKNIGSFKQIQVRHLTAVMVTLTIMVLILIVLGVLILTVLEVLILIVLGLLILIVQRAVRYHT